MQNLCKFVHQMQQMHTIAGWSKVILCIEYSNISHAMECMFTSTIYRYTEEIMLIFKC